ncbi:uncharacterized protein FOMMEDRAFT_160336 [Fomitiporia mediterranea MF3/22]|uniref:uncharacterized protein n=1 Tax=Fomitiporia mediterranea (strain MF3/22) TaxID=694068 RepID=UPI00044098B8|nr:uncharacterized protein FOMMEDRAFT_160336 [Fomitiporia mediterranea MF3/22]EJC99881.1 hypothetical protein FOMMEDRAFT_160336 [Fomitiporia mediterranea MF3/22]
MELQQSRLLLGIVKSHLDRLVYAIRLAPPKAIFAVKAKFKFPFGKQVVSNPYNFSEELEPCAAMFLILIGFGTLILAWASLRVVLTRKALERSKVKDIKGLIMFPTMTTMSVRSRNK